MNDRILDLSELPARLSVRNDLLVILVQNRGTGVPPVADHGQDGRATEAYRCEHDPDPAEQAVPLADIAVLIAAHPQISFTHAVLAGLAEAGGMFIACNEKHMPCAMLLPLATHSTQAERFAAQAALPVPNRKRLWQQIVKAKIRAQANVLMQVSQQTSGASSDAGLTRLAARVRSGDPENLEAQAARIYWKNLFGEDDFRRNPEGEGLNPALNYGYAVLRAMVARALCAAGLHPSLGIHHHNRYDAFCLADDLMEPFRPVVDRAVVRLKDQRGPNPPLDRETKRVLLEALLARFEADGESRTLFDWIGRTATSLAKAVEHGEKQIEIPPL